ncbi:amino acid ABC transporter permease [Spirochaeta cellobiosiphila]|uniref:amino acid ABC transporter permease n=1 Tax=Spirochaeta cellobiosiphila TaxID=504483 RepID=UPI0003FE280E|nr:amino acid ABC transporter permease [Spirochaeta cellobiosiphila]
MKKTINYIRKNYLNTPGNTLLSIFLFVAISWVCIKLFSWAIINAVWTGDSQDVANPNGATWAFINKKIRFFMYGFYPLESIWRINIAFVLFVLSFIPYMSKKINQSIYFLIQMIFWPIIVFLLIQGGLFVTEISSNNWGGLTLTLLLSSMGLMFSFPLGILLALGRRSQMPIVKVLSIVYIEFFRGIPLITILFMSSVVVPFFLPNTFVIDKYVRVIMGMTFFQSAYLAEVIRGGLQSLNKGQYEAADSLGLPYFLKTYLVIMPQALKMTITNIGGISVSFIKDTTLVMIIGMFDVLGIVKPLTGDSNWLGMEPEGLIFAGIIYWILCAIVSKVALHIETKANTLPEVHAVPVEGEA